MNLQTYREYLIDIFENIFLKLGPLTALVHFVLHTGPRTGHSVFLIHYLEQYMYSEKN